ncbi:RraA family protein [Pantoea sp. ME81]|uniref:RraA family protein n=1 Tax=Pantoea sp. ME81 TaxID=2743935 RepID=UPI0015F6A0C3|nr:RraA family protein [Pantoea sp. ME81]
MTAYKALPELIPQSLLDRARALSPALLCDGMQSLDIPRNGCMDAGLNPLDDRKVMVGTACTVDTEDGDNFPIHVAIYQSQPGYVLVIAGKNYPERAYIGDLLVGAAQAVGLSGVVMDGYVRDKTGLAELTIPVYSRGIMQRSPIKRGPGKINTVVQCAGVEVVPGDLIVGDCDGVTVIPRDQVEAVLTIAEKKAAYEDERRAAIHEYARCREDNLPLPNLAPSWVTELLAEQK